MNASALVAVLHWRVIPDGTSPAKQGSACLSASLSYHPLSSLSLKGSPWLCGPGWGDGRLTPERSFCFQSSAHTVWGVLLHTLLWACVSYEVYFTWLAHVGTFPIPLSALRQLQVLSAPPEATVWRRVWGPGMDPKVAHPLGRVGTMPEVHSTLKGP